MAWPELGWAVTIKLFKLTKQILNHAVTPLFITEKLKHTGYGVFITPIGNVNLSVFFISMLLEIHPSETSLYPVEENFSFLL